MKSLVELQSEILSLQQQAAELRTREFDTTIAEILAKMAAFGITLRHLREAAQKPGSGRKRGRPRGKAKAKSTGKGKVASANSASTAKAAKGKKLGARKPAQIKYRGPGGETWSGRGKTPVWIRSFIAAGHKQEDYKV